MSWESIGDLRRARGDLEGAEERYEAALVIMQKLAAADPQNARWQWDLVVSLWNLADLAERRNDPVTALGQWQQPARIARELASTGRLAPADAEWLPELDRRLATAQAKAGRGGQGE